MNIHDVDEGIQRYRKRHRVGRGPGSGHGKTSGRGHNGQRSRAGASFRPTFEGGQMPLVRRVPKRGFNNRWALTVYSINVGQLDALFADGDEVNVETLREKNRAKSRFDVLKILGDGELTKKLKISAHRFSKSASEKIAKVGGEAIVVPGKKPVIKGVRKSAKADS
jgi:large subunit ribosomal protein L15